MKVSLAEKRSDNVPEIASTQAKDKGPWYPSLYISNNEDLSGLKLDQEVTLRGKVRSVRKDERDGKVTYGCDIEVHSLDMPEGGKKKSISKPTSAAEDEAAIEEGMEEEESE